MKDLHSGSPPLLNSEDDTDSFLDLYTEEEIESYAREYAKARARIVEDATNLRHTDPKEWLEQIRRMQKHDKKGGKQP